MRILPPPLEVHMPCEISTTSKTENLKWLKTVIIYIINWLHIILYYIILFINELIVQNCYSLINMQ